MIITMPWWMVIIAAAVPVAVVVVVVMNLTGLHFQTSSGLGQVPKRELLRIAASTKNVLNTPKTSRGFYSFFCHTRNNIRSTEGIPVITIITIIIIIKIILLLLLVLVITGSVDVVLLSSVCQISVPSPQVASVCISQPTWLFLFTATHQSNSHKTR